MRSYRKSTYVYRYKPERQVYGKRPWIVSYYWGDDYMEEIFTNAITAIKAAVRLRQQRKSYCDLIKRIKVRKSRQSESDLPKSLRDDLFYQKGY